MRRETNHGGVSTIFFSSLAWFLPILLFRLYLNFHFLSSHSRLPKLMNHVCYDELHLSMFLTNIDGSFIKLNYFLFCIRTMKEVTSPDLSLKPIFLTVKGREEIKYTVIWSGWLFSWINMSKIGNDLNTFFWTDWSAPPIRYISLYVYCITYNCLTKYTCQFDLYLQH